MHSGTLHACYLRWCNNMIDACVYMHGCNGILKFWKDLTLVLVKYWYDNSKKINVINRFYFDFVPANCP